MLVDAKLVNIALSSKEGLNKGIEPDGSDKMISVSGHRTLFSADTDSPYWRLIRKGTTAAFQYKNIRCLLHISNCTAPCSKKGEGVMPSSFSSSQTLFQNHDFRT